MGEDKEVHCPAFRLFYCHLGARIQTALSKLVQNYNSAHIIKSIRASKYSFGRREMRALGAEQVSLVQMKALNCRPTHEQ